MGELVDHHRHVGRQTARLGLAQLATRPFVLAHGRQHPRQFQAHPRGIGFLVQDGAQQHGGIGVTLLIRQHHGFTEARLGADLHVRIVGQGLVDGLGVFVALGRLGFVGQGEKLGGGDVLLHRLAPGGCGYAYGQQSGEAAEQAGTDHLWSNASPQRPR